MSYISCSSSTKLVDNKRSGLHKKRAASRFGEPKLQLSPSFNTPRKVRLAEGISKEDAKAEQKATEEPEHPTVPTLSRPRPNPRLCSSDVRQELLDTMLLYNVNPAAAASKPLARCKSETLMPNGPDSRRFAAAGVVAISFGPPDGHIRLLLTQERNPKSLWRRNLVPRRVWDTMVPYNLPGGKRKKVDEDARATALRELEEETAGLLTSSDVGLHETTTFFWLPSNYYAFTCRLDGQDDLPERFAALLADPPADMSSCSTRALAWMPVRELPRWPRSDFLDRLFNGTSIPAWLCAQQQQHDQGLLDSSP